MRQGVALLLLTFLIAAFAILFVGARSIKTELDALVFADSDNLGWNISQLDVDYRGLHAALLEPLIEASEAGTEITQSELAQVKLAFDIFYSRVSVVTATFTRVGKPEEITDQLNRVTAFRNEVADQIDAIEVPTSAEIEALLQATIDLSPDVRGLTTAGIQALGAVASEAREIEHQIFQRFYVKLFSILGFVLLSCLLAVRLWRDLEHRNRKIEMAATNVNNAIESALSAVIFLDTNGMIVQCNHAAETHFGSDRKELIGVDFIHAFIDRDSLPKFFAYRDAKDANPIRLTARTAEYRAFPVEMSGSWQKDVEGNDIYIIYLLDISEKLEAEEKLKASRDEAKEASHAKSRFLATMSHEMRTPLHGLIASMDMIQTSSLSDADQQLFKTARECTTRALEQVNGILDHTRTTQMEEREHPFRPCRVIRDIRESLTPLATANGTSIEFSFSGDGAEARYIGLPDSFSRVMYNLIGNAIKFTKNGAILIELIATQGDTPGARRLNIVVKDTGSGIAVEDQIRIFEQFETATSFADENAKGTGLGLAIVKHSLAQMNSTIELRSALGQGSRFSFSLHLEIDTAKEEVAGAQTQADPITEKAVTGKKHVLIVDDNAVNRTVLREMVSRLGLSPECVTSGFEAVDAAEKVAYDLILMDVNMPGMSGHDATRIIRASSGRSAETVILGVTALIPTDHDKQTDSGMNAMLAKPLTSERLLAATRRHLQAEEDADEEESIIDLLDPDTARELKTQSLADAKTALQVMTDPASSWDARVDKIHYAVGSTAVVGFNSLSQFLAQAESAAKAKDQASLDACAEQIRNTISA